VQKLVEKIAEVWVALTGHDNRIAALEARITSLESQLASGVSASSASASSPTSNTSTTTPDTSSSAEATQDEQPPVITINGNNPAEIEVGTTYSDLGATVTDNVNNNLGITTYVDGVQVSSVSLDTASSTTYTISYTVTDQAGNTATSTRQVVISEPEVVETVPDEEPIDVTETEEETASSTPEVVEEDTSTSTPQT